MMWMQVDQIDPNQWLPYMPGLVLSQWLELGAAKRRGTLDSYSRVVPSKWTGKLLGSYHCCIAYCFSKNSQCFCRSMVSYTWWNSLTMWKWRRIEMVQILSNFFQAGFWFWNLLWMPHSKIFMPQILPRPKPTARTQFIDCAANTADSSPAAQCGNAKQTSSAISAAVVFV